jgi:hypothetical protein
MRRSRLPASTVATRAAPSALDQAIESPAPGTEAAQSNGHLGTPSWILVGVIIAFAVMCAFRIRLRR